MLKKINAVYLDYVEALKTKGLLMKKLPKKYNKLNGEVNLTFDGTTLGVNGGASINVAGGSISTNGGNIVTGGGNVNMTGGGNIDGNGTNNITNFGTINAAVKNFDIEHPTKPGKRLVYGVLEGPEHGVYHRGTAEGKSPLTIVLPEYWDVLVGKNYTINLTSWDNSVVHIVEKTENYFTIQLVGDPISRRFKNYKVDYIVHGSRLDAPLEIEQ